MEISTHDLEKVRFSVEVLCYNFLWLEKKKKSQLFTWFYTQFVHIRDWLVTDMNSVLEKRGSRFRELFFKLSIIQVNYDCSKS